MVLKRIAGIILICTIVSCSNKSTLTYTVVSIPDFLNVDTNFPQPGWEESLDVFLRSVAAEQPDLVIIPGDLVMGHWDQTVEGIDYWADKYYPEWIRRLDQYHFKYLVTVGDHELGDNDWPAEKAKKVPVFKKAFVRNFNTPDNGPSSYKGTSYYLVDGNILFIMLDCYKSDLKIGEESCQPVIAEEQISWLDSVIMNHSSVDHIVVAGHVPVLAPVRKLSSSGMILQEREQSGFWKLLKEKKVDFYLCGEVHDVTCSFDLPVIQIAHGGLFGYNNRVNYLVMKFTGKKINCRIKEFDLDCSGERLWQTGQNRPFENIKIYPNPRITGELTILKEENKEEIIKEDGMLSQKYNKKEKIVKDQQINNAYTLKVHHYKMSGDQ